MARLTMFRQEGVKRMSRVRCKQSLVINPNTSYAKQRECQRFATVLLDGVPLCESHAGLRLVKELLNADAV